MPKDFAFFQGIDHGAHRPIFAHQIDNPFPNNIEICGRFATIYQNILSSSDLFHVDRVSNTLHLFRW
jgi:hypothetical protein